MLRVFTFAALVCLSNAAVAKYSWEDLAEPNSGKHCLCRYMDYGVFLRDVIVRDVSGLGKKCLSKCPPSTYLCSVYKLSKGNGWQASNRQPEELTDECGYFLRPLPLADYVAARTAVKGQDMTTQEKKTLHFFWWGNPNTERHRPSAMQGPSALADLLVDKGYIVKYHHQSTATAFTTDRSTVEPALSNKVTTSPITTIGDFLQGTDLADQANAINNIIGTFGTYNPRGFAAIKDLAIMCILYKEGGYFLDTSVTVFPDTTADDLAAAWNSFAEDPFPKYPRLGDADDKQTVYFHMADEQALSFRKIEFNGAYVPKRHPATKLMIQHYIKLAAHFKFNTGARIVDDDWHRAWSEGGERHKNIVGAMIRESVIKGMAEFAKITPVNPGWMVFDADKVIDADRGALKGLNFNPLKIFKEYKGSWKPRPNQVNLEEDLELLSDDIAELLGH